MLPHAHTASGRAEDPGTLGQIFRLQCERFQRRIQLHRVQPWRECRGTHGSPLVRVDAGVRSGAQQTAHASGSLEKLCRASAVPSRTGSAWFAERSLPGTSGGGDHLSDAHVLDAAHCPRGTPPRCDPDLVQLADNVWRPPEWRPPERVRYRHLPIQITNLFGGFWSSRLARAQQLRPVLAELPSAPSDDGLGAYDHESVAPAGPNA